MLEHYGKGGAGHYTWSPDEHLLRLHKEGDCQGIGNRVARQLLWPHRVGAVEDCDLLHLPLNPEHLHRTMILCYQNSSQLRYGRHQVELGLGQADALEGARAAVEESWEYLGERDVGCEGVLLRGEARDSREAVPVQGHLLLRDLLRVPVRREHRGGWNLEVLCSIMSQHL